MSLSDPRFIAFSAVWIAAVIVASIAYRRAAGKPILFFSLPGARFVERKASGYSQDNWFRRLGVASGCLVVGVVNDRLIIRPRFPFNLMFVAEIYGLELEIPLTSVRGAAIERRLFRRQLVIRFEDEKKRLRSFALVLEKPELLAELLQPPAPGQVR